VFFTSCAGAASAMRDQPSRLCVFLSICPLGYCAIGFPPHEAKMGIQLQYRVAPYSQLCKRSSKSINCSLLVNATAGCMLA
jgi:hypothetical protein